MTDERYEHTAEIDRDRVRRPVPEPATKPCKPCNGYGYFGHTNPALGDRCSACGGSGVLPEVNE